MTGAGPPEDLTPPAVNVHRSPPIASEFPWPESSGLTTDWGLYEVVTSIWDSFIFPAFEREHLLLQSLKSASEKRF